MPGLITTAQRHNTYRANKIAIRKALLESLGAPARVLDLYCGEGILYDACYRDSVEEYQGVDKKWVHTESICSLADNWTYLKQHDVKRFNFIDADAFGNGWLIAIEAARRIDAKRFALAITDGSDVRTSIARFDRGTMATMGIPRTMPFPAAKRWAEYARVYLIRALQDMANCQVTRLLHAHNAGSTHYFGCLCERRHGS